MVVCLSNQGSQDVCQSSGSVVSYGAYVVYNREQWVAFLVGLRRAIQARDVFLSRI